ncbi:hypothetical protein [Shewanella pealeana]|uniref:hypothetical protein n=1 Tax=Shewanella pealeana TaxID=70864 RepID=UPI0002D8D0B7|nr:hypothetical protein [Shewanella pealeana]
MDFRANSMHRGSASFSALPVMLIANIWEAIFEYIIYRTPKCASRQVNTEKKA